MKNKIRGSTTVGKILLICVVLMFSMLLGVFSNDGGTGNSGAVGGVMSVPGSMSPPDAGEFAIVLNPADIGVPGGAMVPIHNNGALIPNSSANALSAFSANDGMSNSEVFRDGAIVSSGLPGVEAISGEFAPAAISNTNEFDFGSEMTMSPAIVGAIVASGMLFVVAGGFAVKRRENMVLLTSGLGLALTINLLVGPADMYSPILSAILALAIVDTALVIMHTKGYSVASVLTMTFDWMVSPMVTGLKNMLKNTNLIKPDHNGLRQLFFHDMNLRIRASP